MTASSLIQGANRVWRAKIGLEIHCQINSASKLFSNAPLPELTSPANTCVSLFDAAVPGTLPVLNRECVRQALRAALALNCDIHRVSTFERKHYYYQDLPLGYQITQQERPIASRGFLEFKTDDDTSSSGKVLISRIQLEQDSGKSLHDLLENTTCVDLNRAGQGLLEVVFEPTLHTAKDAGVVVKTFQQLVRHMGVCDGSMEKGSMRVDVNVSVETADGSGGGSYQGSQKGSRVEVKNLNSIQRIMQAVDHEAGRQIDILERGEHVNMETRGFDAARGKTHRLRSKETAVDYRFMPDPDLPPLCLDEAFIVEVQSSLPETPADTVSRLTDTAGAGLSYDQVQVLLAQESVSFFDAILLKGAGSLDVAKTFHWVATVLAGHLNAVGTSMAHASDEVSADQAVAILKRLQDGTLTPLQGKDVLEELTLIPLTNGERQAATVPGVMQRLGISDEAGTCVSDNNLSDLCQQVVRAEGNHKQLKRFKAGKTGVAKYFVGEVMRATRGRADPKKAEAAVMSALADEIAD